VTFWVLFLGWFGPRIFGWESVLGGDCEFRCGWSGGQRLTPRTSGASTTSLPPGSMLAVTVCGSTVSGRSNSRLNSRQLVRPGVFSSCRAWTTSLRSKVFTVRSPGSNSAPISTAMRNTYQQPFKYAEWPQKRGYFVSLITSLKALMELTFDTDWNIKK